MRIWFGGPRVFGIRPGVSFGREDWAKLARPVNSRALSASERGSFVYVITDERGRSKIGSSADPNDRLRTLQTGSADLLSLVYVCAPDCETPEAVAIERSAQSMLDKYRGNGEWFSVPPSVAVSAIAGAAHQRSVKIADLPLEKVADAVAILAVAPPPTEESPTWHKWLYATLAVLVLFLVLDVLFKLGFFTGTP